MSIVSLFSSAKCLSKLHDWRVAIIVSVVGVVIAGSSESCSIAGVLPLALVSGIFVHLGCHCIANLCFARALPKSGALNGQVLHVMDIQHARKTQPQKTCPLHVYDMQVPFHGYWRLLPMFLSVSTLVVPLGLWLLGLYTSMLLTLTAYGLYGAYKMGVHVAVFSLVGCKLVQLYQSVSFKALYHEQRKQQDSATMSPSWNDVLHFVIVPNYKEDIEVLRLAFESIARSNIAAQQICLVLAMEAREDGAKEKAEKLQNCFHGRFRQCLITYHPPDLPDEMPGKSSNTRWATNQVFECFMPELNVDPAYAIITVADADSEFHHEYFAALTYHFLSGGGNEGETPQRQLTIWQPPILHLKNYIQQPAMVKWCSFITSMHELACLADPQGTRIPYSTYSIPATLAKAVGGWDPEWISEDWHMALKCFLATGGRLQILPIYLPILNFAPEGETVTETHLARWAQAKRHALGFSELVYFLDHFPRILNCISSRRGRIVFIWRSIFLWFNCLMTHLMLGTYGFVAPFNVMISIWYIAYRQIDSMPEGSAFIANSMTQVVTLSFFVPVCIASAILYNNVKDRVNGSEDPTLPFRWKSVWANSIVTMIQTAALLPVFFQISAASEWLAAEQCTHTHRFHYEVALKPNLSKEALESKSESTTSGSDSTSESEETSEVEESQSPKGACRLEEKVMTGPLLECTSPEKDQPVC
jgi:cellulose synthase/poly-beta-1,6-N-acetylglucosamine synthase-like glycosyltransferase